MDRRGFLLATTVSALVAPELAASANAPAVATELSLADIASAYADGRLTSRQLTQRYLDRIASLDRDGPRLGAVLETNPHAIEIAAELDRERQTSRATRASSRRADLDQGQCRDGGSHDDDCRVPSTRRLVRAARRAARGSIARRGRRDSRQDQLERVGQLSIHAFLQWLERPRRSDPQSVRAQPFTVGVEFWIGGGSGREPMRCCNRHGDRRIDRESRLDQRYRRYQADGRTRQPRRHCADNAQSRHRRTSCAERARRRYPSQLDGGLDAADPASVAVGERFERDYVRFLDPDGLRGARLGIARRFFADNAPLDGFLNDCVKTLERAGAIVIDPADLPMHGAAARPNRKCCYTNSRPI
jgi:amidase